jgi:hypothetical protein
LILLAGGAIRVLLSSSGRFEEVSVAVVLGTQRTARAAGAWPWLEVIAAGAVFKAGRLVDRPKEHPHPAAA